MKEVILETPVSTSNINRLELGARVAINGTIYTARDATFNVLKDELKKKKNLVNSLKNSIIYLCGPSPAPKKRLIGSCGPTTTQRMEPYVSLLSKLGVKAIIGKGKISASFLSALKKHNIAYLMAVGGAGAYLTTFIKDASIVAYKNLGPEAVYKLEVENFPCIVAANKGKQIFR